MEFRSRPVIPLITIGERRRRIVPHVPPSNITSTRRRTLSSLGEEPPAPLLSPPLILSPAPKLRNAVHFDSVQATVHQHTVTQGHKRTFEIPDASAPHKKTRLVSPEWEDAPFTVTALMQLNKIRSPPPLRASLFKNSKTTKPFQANSVVDRPHSPSIISDTLIDSVSSPTNSRHASPESLSSLSSIEDDSAGVYNSANLIAKPTGEAGRRGRGGYNLREALSLHRAQYNKLAVHSIT